MLFSSPSSLPPPTSSLVLPSAQGCVHTEGSPLPFSCIRTPAQDTREEKDPARGLSGPVHRCVCLAECALGELRDPVLQALRSNSLEGLRHRLGSGAGPRRGPEGM